MSYEYYKVTKSICPECRKPILAKIVFENEAVFMLKHCRQHGDFKALLYSDRQRYIDSLKIHKPALYPLKVANPVYQDCAGSCGLCPEHQQHTCLPIIEITDHCNMDCPICLANNRSSYHLSPAEFKKKLDHLIDMEGSLDLINLSGGEPTLHPQLPELIALAKRPEIAGISISTNGREFLKNKDLLKMLIDNQVFISLQFDGFTEKAYLTLRGRKMLAEKLKILDLLEKYSAAASLVMTVMKGVNDREIGKVVQYFMKKDFLRSLMFQPFAFLNPRLKYDINRVMTIPDVAKEIARGSKGIIGRDDLVNLPCSHAQCFALTYLLGLENGRFITLNKLVKVEEYLDIIKNRTMAGLDEESYQAIKDCIYQLWSAGGVQPQADKILKTIKLILKEIETKAMPGDPRKALAVGQKHIKSIFIHHFMDAYNFDFARVRKCCNQYPVGDDKLIPCCSYNNLKYRNFNPILDYTD